jgi:predicted TIM-barrel fold metal-dependent hydrolase
MLDVHLLWQQAVERIDVPVHRLHGRDRRERVEHGAPSDIPRVKDRRHARKRVEQVVANQTVRVRDEPDYDGSVTMRICDAHCHFFSTRFLELLTAGVASFPDDGRGSAVSHRLGWNDPGTPEALADRWTAELDRQGVARAALIASIPGDEGSVHTAVARHPDRFVGFFMFNPAAGDVTARLSRTLEDGHMRGICLFPAMHGYRLDDERVRDVFAAAAARRAVVFAHCGVLSVGARKKLGLPSPFDLRLGDPLALAATASRFADVPVIVPHFGAGMFREVLIAADQCPNLCLDTSSSNGWMKYYPGLTLETVFRQALAVLGPDRLLFGTDSSFFPRGWQRPILDMQMDALTAAGISDADRAKILAGNFDRLFSETS